MVSPMDFSNVPIENDFNEESYKYSSVVERYYTKRYCLDVSTEGDDYCILIHSNRVCLVTLARSHFLFKHPDIVSVNFNVDSVDRLKNKVSGKWKHGAQKLRPESPLISVTCSDGSAHLIRSGITGKLLEVNKSLLENPKLLLTHPQGKGYIAVVLSDISVVEQYKDSLPNEELYKLLMYKRRQKSSDTCPPVLPINFNTEDVEMSYQEE